MEITEKVWTSKTVFYIYFKKKCFFSEGTLVLALLFFVLDKNEGLSQKVHMMKDYFLAL